MSKKAAYTFLFYPDLADVEVLIWALNAMGWNYRISPLHDKDVTETGEPKKPHYHVIVGFSENAPEYKKFKAAIEGISPCCSVPPINKCIVKDLIGAVQYHQHENDLDKAQYCVDDAVESESWYAESYMTKEQKADAKRIARQRGKQDRADCLAFCMDWLSTPGNPCELSSLLDYVRKERPDLFLLAIENSYVLKSYADSKRHCERDDEVKELRAKCDELLEDLADANDKLICCNLASVSIQQAYINGDI